MVSKLKSIVIIDPGIEVDDCQQTIDSFKQRFLDLHWDIQYLTDPYISVVINRDNDYFKERVQQKKKDIKKLIKTMNEPPSPLPESDAQSSAVLPEESAAGVNEENVNADDDQKYVDEDDADSDDDNNIYMHVQVFEEAEFANDDMLAGNDDIKVMDDDEIEWNNCAEYQQLVSYGFDPTWIKCSLTLYNKNVADCLEYLLSTEYNNSKNAYDAILVNDQNAYDGTFNVLWKCVMCGFKNREAQLMCLLCSLGQRPAAAISAEIDFKSDDDEDIPPVEEVDTGPWNCPLCSYENDDSKLIFCDMCQKGKNYLQWEKLLSGESPIMKRCRFVSNNDKNGVVFWIGTLCGQQKWKNPGVFNRIKCEASTLTQDSEPVTSTLTDRLSVRCVTTAKPDSWMMIDFIHFKIRPTHYSLRHYISWRSEALRNWVLEGSNTTGNMNNNGGKKWIVLRDHKNDAALYGKGSISTWQLTVENDAYRYFRIRQTGLNSNNHHYLACSGFELYGYAFPVKAMQPLNEIRVLMLSVEEEPVQDFDHDERLLQSIKKEVKSSFMSNLSANGHVFNYKSDFDENGILYFLGTKYGTDIWRNPALTDVVTVGSSGMDEESVPVTAICGRTAERCVSSANADSWIMIDLRRFFIKISHYTLRHYSSWDHEVLRNWYFQASQDAVNWITLKTHKNDAGLAQKRGSTKTWKIIGEQRRFRAFRILQFARNSNGHLWLACSGLEFYGTMYLEK